MASGYNADGGGAAGEQPAAPPAEEQGGDAQSADQPQGREDTFFLPPDYPGIENLKKGDTVTLRVVGKDEDGNVEVECDPKAMAAKGGNAYKPMMEDFDDSMKG